MGGLPRTRVESRAQAAIFFRMDMTLNSPSLTAPCFGRAWSRRAPFVLIIAAVIALAAAVAVAEDAIRDWIPGVLQLPADAEVLSEREVGSTVRMLTISTAEDVAVLLVDWERALQDDGYIIDQSQDDALQGSVEFSGQGIVNGKIAASPVEQDGRRRIEIDATLE